MKNLQCIQLIVPVTMIPCLEPLAEAVRRTSDKSFQEKVFILMPGVVALMVEE